MNENIIIISDLFKEDFAKLGSPPGGAELNDDVVFRHLDSLGLVKEKIHSSQFPPEEMVKYLKKNKECIFFISNFSALSFIATIFLMENCKYYIYEHDYKFHKLRNPIEYRDFIVPKHQLMNINFFKKAQEVICLSKLHFDIFKNNLNISNLHNTTCSLWSEEILKHIETLSETEKNGKFAVVDSDNPIKRKEECIKYCTDNGIDFDLISSKDYKDFLSIMAKYEAVVILPGHPEPTPRVAVEAKMLNCKIHSNKKSLGVAHEKWFHLNGAELIKEVRKIRESTLNYITGRLLASV